MSKNITNLTEIISTARIEKLREKGVIFFDVDDTLLARRNSKLQKDQVFAESEAAAALPRLLEKGVRICIVTGHGWAQLNQRLIAPLVKEIKKDFGSRTDDILKNFHIYANRGATKIVWTEGDFIEDQNYGRKFAFNRFELIELRRIFDRLQDILLKDYEERKDWYHKKYQNFDFTEFPPKIVERENVILSLRPIPSQAHCKSNTDVSLRRKLFEIGTRKLQNSPLADEFSIEESGKSTLEITRKIISKKNAVDDLFEDFSRDFCISSKVIAESSIYVGDEFSLKGNDLVIAQNFPEVLCFSVSCEKINNSLKNVVNLTDFVNESGVPATSLLINALIEFFDLKQSV